MANFVGVLLLALVAAPAATHAFTLGRVPRRLMRPDTFLQSSPSEEEDPLSAYPSWLRGDFNLSLPLPQVSVPSFVSGAVFGVSALVAALFLPVLSSEDLIDSSADSRAAQVIERPVVLFEDILRDLSSSYVEDVNTNKLFETAVSSMLRSLDPYTEFENVESSKNL